MGAKKTCKIIGVHGEIEKVVVTSVVMRHFCILPGAPRACADFCDPTAVSRFNESGVHSIGKQRRLKGESAHKERSENFCHSDKPGTDSHPSQSDTIPRVHYGKFTLPVSIQKGI